MRKALIPLILTVSLTLIYLAIPRTVPSVATFKAEPERLAQTLRVCSTYDSPTQECRNAYAARYQLDMGRIIAALDGKRAQ